MELNYYEIGQRVRKTRKRCDLTQDELAERVDISTTHMSHIETGNTRMSLTTFAALAQALGASTDELLFGSVPVNRTQVMERTVQMLESCSTAQLGVLEEILWAAKQALDKNEGAL